MNIHGKTFAVVASFTNECLLIVTTHHETFVIEKKPQKPFPRMFYCRWYFN